MNKLYFFIFLFSFKSILAQDTLNQLSLTQAIEIGLNKNLSIKKSALDIELSKADLNKSKIRPNPVFNGQFLYLTDQIKGQEFFTDPTRRQDWFQLTKKFQLYGLRQEKINLSESILQNKKFDYQYDQRELIYAICQSWLNVWNAQLMKELAFQSLETIEETILDDDSLSQELLDNNEELLRFAIMQDQFEVLDLESDYKLKQNLYELNKLIYSTGIQSVNIEDSVRFLYAEMKLDSLLAHGLKYRSEIKMNQQNVTIAKYNINYQKTLTFSSPEIGLLYNPQNQINYVGLYITQALPFFDRNQSDKQRSKIEYNQAKLYESNIRFQIIQEIKQAYIGYERNYIKLKKMIEMRTLSNQLLENVKKKINNKLVSKVDIWEAHRTWFEIEKMYYNALFDYYSSCIELQYRSGYFDYYILNRSAE
jgi:cobalt-zinc-cadmium efflux system outer membrane protein